MEIKILAPLWGHEHLEQRVFLDKIRSAGYDGFDMWLPDNQKDYKEMLDYLQQFNMVLVAHQHQAEGLTFDEFKLSFIKNLERCAQAEPVLINSHTGRDYFTFEQNLRLVDIATAFSLKTGITVAHETHRGRIAYSPPLADAFFNARPQMEITADFSHWVCVSESMLENFTTVLDKAISRTRHVHARIGYEQGPQVPDPRAPEWAYATNTFLCWWDKIVSFNRDKQKQLLTFTTEFGPPPYLHTIPYTNEPVADQFELNCFMLHLLKNRYT